MKLFKFKPGAYERKKKKLERIKKELETDNVIIEDNSNMFLLLLTVGEIRTLSTLILSLGLAIIGATLSSFLEVKVTWEKLYIAWEQDSEQ